MSLSPKALPHITDARAALAQKDLERALLSLVAAYAAGTDADRDQLDAALRDANRGLAAHRDR